VQYASGLPGGVAMTVTLADHGRRDISVPTAGETALAVEHPEVAEALGV
jgi:hypothetical protein